MASEQTSQGRLDVLAPCPICAHETLACCSKLGRYSGIRFELRRCPACRYAYVANPLRGASLYDDRYYAGNGADPLVDYIFEAENPSRSIRAYEWSGILAIVKSLVRLSAQTRWLDYGCGTGGLVQYCCRREAFTIRGYDTGWAAEFLCRRSIPSLSAAELSGARGSFDVVTAIEVLEHASDPLALLHQIRSLLRPGGLFFFTTGNARPFRHRLARWRYVVPEIHLSFFEPETLRRALSLAGFQPESRIYVPGDTEVIRFKILKNLGIRTRSAAENLMPWDTVARLVDTRLELTAHPIGWAVGTR